MRGAAVTHPHPQALTWCSGTPTPGRSSVCRREEPLTSGHRGTSPPSCRKGKPLRTGLDPALDLAWACLDWRERRGEERGREERRGEERKRGEERRRGEERGYGEGKKRQMMRVIGSV